MDHERDPQPSPEGDPNPDFPDSAPAEQAGWSFGPPAASGDEDEPAPGYQPPPPGSYWAPPPPSNPWGASGSGPGSAPGGYSGGWSDPDAWATSAGGQPGTPGDPYRAQAQEPYDPYRSPGQDPYDPYRAQPQEPYGRGGGSWVTGGPGGWGPPGPGGPGLPPAGSGWNYGWSGGGRQPHRTLPTAVTALLLVVAVLVGLGIGHGVWRANRASLGSGSNTPGNSSGNSSNPFGLNPSGSGGSNSSGNGGSNNGSGTGSANAGTIASAVSPDLVDINTTLYGGEAAGTGIVLTANGYVLTNNHVISESTTIRATDIGNGRTYNATVVGYDRTGDVAVIKLDGASGLQTAKIGDSNSLNVGDAVVGIGNAGGTGGTPSAAAGRVTALNQSIVAQDQSNGTSEQLTGLIQTDANIQQGDSGGPLVNQSGQVIGMDTAASQGFSFESNGSQGFAIPIDTAISIANQIRSGQATSDIHIGPTAFLGVLVQTNAQQPGAALSNVVPNGPAAKAGLAGGDVITSFGGSTVDSPATLTNLIAKHRPGDTVQIGWVDANGQQHTGSVQLSSGPPQ